MRWRLRPTLHHYGLVQVVVLVSLLAGTAVVAARRAPSDPLDALRQSFLAPPPESRVMMRWWWFGPAVATQEIARELEAMKAGGIGGVEIQPVYPLEPDDSSRGIRNLPYLSDDFLEALRFANTTARRLGLRVDLTLGSGWPFGGATVGIDHAAGKLRVERVPAGSMAPGIGPGEQLITALPAGDGSTDTLFFISSRTGMMVKRAGVGAEGFVLDHYDRGALDAYLQAVGARLFRAFEGAPPYAIFCDSLEVYEADWTPGFVEAFAARRGYDLTSHLPSLVQGGRAESAALRHDWGQTLTELAGERFIDPLEAWARQHDTRLRMQGYGIPPATVSSSKGIDLPEGEGAQWKTLSATRWASSASHLSGVPVTSSETWTWLHSPVFRASPLDMKAEADRHFLQGINQLIGHGWPYTPPGIEDPGWRFYAAGVFNDRNPWWTVMPDVTAYLQRLSFILRQGTAIDDVAVYLPTDDAWAAFTPGHVNLIETLRDTVGPTVIPQVLDAGFGFDLVDDEGLASSRPYRAIVLPGVERISRQTLERLERFARGGGVVIATRRLPSIAPGFTATPADHAQIRESVRRLFDDAGAPGHFVMDEAALGAALRGLLHPDVSITPAAPDVGFTHRRTDEADIYFVANTGNTRQSVAARFRVNGDVAEAWDPMSGRIVPRPSTRSADGLTVTLDLEPYGSRVLVFPRHAPPGGVVRARATPASQPTVTDISADWRVTFAASSPPVAMDRLRSWTDDQATRFFSGVATYDRAFVATEEMLGRGRRVTLDLGEGRAIPPETLRSGMQAWLDAPVREAAVVYVNDRRVGSVWCPPYALDITSALVRGSNRIRIEVANLAINAVAGRPLPNYRLLNLRYGVRFEAQDMDKVQPVPSGLIGPIRLLVTVGSAYSAP